MQKDSDTSSMPSESFIMHSCSIAWPSNFRQDLPVQLKSPQDIQHDLGWDRIFMGAASTLHVYDSASNVVEATRDLNYVRVSTIAENDNLAIIATKGSCTHLFFRGSYNLKNWFSNASIRKKRVKHGKIHVGFYKILTSNNFYKKIITTLDEHNYKNHYFQVSGHSLGGALAGAFSYLYATDKTRKDKEIDLVVTLGQPLFADSTLAKFLRETYAGRYARVVYKSDIVAKVPPYYEHFGSLIWIKGDSEIKYFPEKPLFSGGSSPSAIKAKIPKELAATPRGFRAFRRELNKNPTPQKPIPEQNIKYGGSFDYFEDHSIIAYYDFINAGN